MRERKREREREKKKGAGETRERERERETLSSALLSRFGSVRFGLHSLSPWPASKSRGRIEKVHTRILTYLLTHSACLCSVLISLSLSLSLSLPLSSVSRFGAVGLEERVEETAAGFEARGNIRSPGHRPPPPASRNIHRSFASRRETHVLPSRLPCFALREGGSRGHQLRKDPYSRSLIGRGA